MSNINRDHEVFDPQVPLPETPEVPEPPGSDDDKLVHVGMFVTRADHLRLRLLGIDLRLSLQRMGHRAWNGFLASQGQPALTAVSPGRQGKNSKPGA